MDLYDKALTGPIWQRVLTPAPAGVPWETLLTGTRRAARAFLALSRSARGSLSEDLRRLAQGKEDQFYILSGLYRLENGQPPRLPPEPPPPREALVPGLCRRYREEAALLSALEDTGDPLLADLGNRVRRDRMAILALLGRAGA